MEYIIIIIMKQILYDRALKIWDTLRTRIEAEKGPSTQKLKKKLGT